MVVVGHGMQTGAHLASWALKAAGFSCSTTTAGSWVPITDCSDSKWVAQPSRRCPYCPEFVSVICSGPVVRSYQANLIRFNGRVTITRKPFFFRASRFRAARYRASRFRANYPPAWRGRARLLDRDAAAVEEATCNIVYDTCLIPSMERVEVNTVNSKFLLTGFNWEILPNTIIVETHAKSFKTINRYRMCFYDDGLWRNVSVAFFAMFNKLHICCN